MSSRENNRLMFLFDRLDRIQFSTRPADLEAAMHEFTHELLQLKAQSSRRKEQASHPQGSSNSEEITIFAKGDETMLHDLAARGAITILLRTMQRCIDCVENSREEGENDLISPQFFNSACIALVHFCFQNPPRSRYCLDNGGLDVIIDVIQMYRSVDYVQIICIAALMVLGKTSSNGNCPWNIEITTLQEILFGMEAHPDNAKLYTVACSALGTLFGPGSTVLVNDDSEFSEEEEEWYHRALSAISYGLVVHIDDAVALSVGNTLLTNMVGSSEVAEEMVAEAEKAAHGTMHCAPAA
eukprot:CAMPEP_0178738506 /NCGR_PEP_ID=MMETSP0744-20121128/3549_1 /TAXON_ID=913974 /ORGANISM="Nitzschia punctata, Strain CCMP561" /LENGTH=297 /DNA_ID=CAMNT_0020391129 /DNA_START=371 /DNA_END=1264 /DNA_ORIENTATION=-